MFHQSAFRILRPILLLLFAVQAAFALTYTWKPSTGTYTAITGGTSVAFSAADNGYASVALPFTFTFDSAAYTSIYVTTNGFVNFGSASTDNYNSDLFYPYSISPYSVLAPWWDDLQSDASSSVQYVTTGNSPNRTFIIQYKDYPDFTGTPGLRLNFQIKLSEGSNKIQFAYGGNNGGTPSAYSSASIGIKGTIGGTGYFIDGTSGSKSSGNSALTSASGFPASGTLYTFAPDTTAPTGLTADPKSGKINLTWNRSRQSSFLRYRVYAGTSPTNLVLKDSTAALIDTAISISGLTNGTTYYFAVTDVATDKSESGYSTVISAIPTKPPTVSLTSPTAGSVMTGVSSVTFIASASDSDGTVSRVEFYQGGNLLGTSYYGNPFYYYWYYPTTGVYTLTAKAFDNLGAVTVSAPITYTINAAPTTSLTAPASGTVIAPGSNVNLTATASDADGSVKVVEFFHDGIKIGEDSTNPYAFTWVAPANGQYYLTSRATDNAGAQTTSSSANISVTLPPTVSVTAPAASSVVSPVNGYITLTASASDPDGTINRVEYYNGSTYLGSSSTSPAYSISWYAPAGSQTITAKAFDNLGASTTSSAVTFTVNAVPSVSLIAPAYAGVTAVGSNVTLTATATDADGSVSLVEFYHDGIKIGQSATGPNYSFTWVAPPIGTYYLTAKATDNQGGQSTSSSIPVYVTKFPQVTFTSPAASAVVSSTNNSFYLTAAASDSDGYISRVEFYRAGNVYIGASYSGSPFSYFWSGAASGSQTITAKAYDNVGAATTSTAVTFTVNTTPAVSLSAPLNNAVISPGSNVNLTATASDADGTIKVVEFFRDGIKIGEDSTAPYAYTWTSPPNGKYVLTARATDNLGGQTISSGVTISVTQPPIVSVTSPTSGSLVSPVSNILTLSASASDPDGTIAQVDFYSGATLIGTAFSGSPYSIPWYSPPAGSQTITAKATDNFGATTTSTAVTFTVNSMPTVYMDTPAYGSVYATGSNVSMSAVAGDADGTVKVVEFFKNGIKIGEDSTSPYAFTWVAPTSGSYLLTARATDNAGGQTVSGSLQIYVTKFPQVSITSPASGGLVSSAMIPVPISVSATDSDGTISSVELYIDGSYYTTLYGAPPYNFNWNSPTLGSHTLTARAHDNSTAMTISAPITFTVVPPPTVTITSPANFSGLVTGSSINLSANAASSGGVVTKVEFYRDSSLIGTDANAPFTATVPNAAKGHYRFQARAYDNQGMIGYSSAINVFVNDTAKAPQGSRLFITGHDADDHHNLEFITAGLDYVMFGKMAAQGEIPYRYGAKVGYLGNTNPILGKILDYADPTFINLNATGWDTIAFSKTNPFDALIIGTGVDYVSSTGSAGINAVKAKFADFFNKGGALFVMSEQGLGQSFYNFLPSFGSVLQQTISDQGAFTATPAGLKIGFTEPVVDRDQTHTEFKNVDTTIFSIFETYNVDGSAVSIGASAIIDSGVFVPPPDTVVADPVAAYRSSIFYDTLCIKLTSPTSAAVIHYTLDGGSADTSHMTKPNGDTVCVDHSVTLKADAQHAGWVTSGEISVSVRKTGQVAAPASNVPDGYFASQVCFRMSSLTDSATLYYTLDGGNPDTSHISKPSGDSVCLDRSATVKAVGKRQDWKTSAPSVFTFTKMSQVAKPVADEPDSSYFPDSLCVHFTSATPGAVIHYSLNGNTPDASSPVLPAGKALCVDSTFLIRVVATETNWINSPETSLHGFKKKTAPPFADEADSTYFPASLCVKLTSATDSAVIHYTLDGSTPDSSSTSIANGDTICLDRTVTLRAVAKRPSWTTSDDASYHYLRMQQVAKPIANESDSTYFPDSLCLKFSNSTSGSVFHYTLDGSDPDTSGLTLNQNQPLCLDRSLTVRVVGEKVHWINSEETVVHIVKMGVVAAPQANKPDSSWFQGSMCVTLSSLTAGVDIHYTLDGGDPDTAVQVKTNGDSVCMDGTRLLRMIAKKPLFINSDKTAFNYLKMAQAGKPVADKPDSTYFADSLCLHFTSSTAGADFHYTLDGGTPDTSTRVVSANQSVCLDRTSNLRVVAEKTHWIASAESEYTFLKMLKAARPVSDQADSTYFRDSLCVHFSSATDGAQLHYTLDGSAPDTSALILSGDQPLCVDGTSLFRVVAEKPNWVNSDEIILHEFKMDTAAAPTALPKDSTYFEKSLCVKLSSASEGAVIPFALDGGNPDTSTAVKANGDSVCFDSTTTIKAMAKKLNLIESPKASFTYLKMKQILKPTASISDSTYFPDSLCVRFSTGTVGVTLHYTLDGGSADTSTLVLGAEQSLCVDRTVLIRVVGEKPNWINSEEVVVHVFKMDTVAAPKSDVADSAYFRDSLCFRLSSATSGASIRFALDGSKIDSASRRIGNGDSVCIDRNASVRAVAEKPNWINSPETALSYFRMGQIATPVADRPDTVFYPTLCVHYQSATEGVELHYTLDGGDPDTSSLVKPNGDSVCIEESARIRVIAKKVNWITSNPIASVFTKMPKVAAPRADVADTVVFAKEACFMLTSATDGALIEYGFEDEDPLQSGRSLANGEKLCLENSTVVTAVATKPEWRNSDLIRIVAVHDSLGPDIIKAVKHPYNPLAISIGGSCGGNGQDTLSVTLTEKIKAVANPAQWDKLMVFSPTCDTSSVQDIPLASTPVFSEDSLSFTVMLDNNANRILPAVGSCIYLDRQSAQFTDRVGNAPRGNGAKLEGAEDAVHISHVRAYPPVVGIQENQSYRGCADVQVDESTWIPPYGFSLETNSVDPDVVASCTPGQGESGASGSSASIPPCTSIIEVMSDGAYVADIAIFDQLGNFVNSSRQQFGNCGELLNQKRDAGGKKRSFLVWNVHDRNGRLAGNGVYVWRINFKAEVAGQTNSQIVSVRTGFLRNPSCRE